MKNLLALAASIAILGHSGLVLAETSPSGGSNNGGATPAATAAPGAPSTESVGIVGAATFAAAALVYAGVALAQHERHPKASYSGSAAPAGRTLSGRVLAVDTAANSLVIMTKQGELPLNVNSAAKIKVGKEKNLADLKAGSKIKVSYNTEGARKVAIRIW